MKTPNKTLMVLFALGGLAIAASSVQAEPRHPQRDPRINGRQHAQHDRIRQGVRSGSLTRDEAKSLSAEQRSIRQEERQYKSDGKMTHEERQDVRQDQNAASKDIYQAKHNGESR
jgi:uncharacterized protein (DUF3084 family)